MARKVDDADTEVLRVGGVQDFHSGQFRTKFAAEAVDLAELFKLLIGTTPLRGPMRFQVELAAPDGPSTGGGVQSVQHIKLVADDGGTTLVAGWADQSAGRCELRTIEYLDAQHRQRFRRSALKAPPAPSERLDRKHYQQLIERLRTFFGERDLVVSIVNAPEARTLTRTAAVSGPARRGSNGRLLALSIGGLVGAVVSLLVYWLALRGR